MNHSIVLLIYWQVLFMRVNAETRGRHCWQYVVVCWNSVRFFDFTRSHAVKRAETQAYIFRESHLVAEACQANSMDSVWLCHKQ
jgi:hypothetical protein